MKHQFSAVGWEFSLEVGGGLETRDTAMADEPRGCAHASLTMARLRGGAAQVRARHHRSCQCRRHPNLKPVFPLTHQSLNQLGLNVILCIIGIDVTQMELTKKKNNKHKVVPILCVRSCSAHLKNIGR